MNNFNSVRFNRVIKITDVVIKVFKIFFMVLFALTVLAIAIIALMPSDLFVVGGEGIRIGISLHPVIIDSSELVITESLKPLILSALFLGLMYLPFTYLVFRLIGLVIQKTKEKVPFDSMAITHLFKLSYVFLVGGLVLPLINLIALAVIRSNYAGINFSLEYSPHMNMMFTGVLVYILANIFEYGGYLQSEVDATV